MPTTRQPAHYYAPTGGHPPQTQLTADRAVFTEAYAL
ncbi:MAG TPA: (S)-ureidoglycine aminohydrolase, partial [Halomonas sp.]|nr:(S)-ureidoglycine aminohydrolase [Halomonas sp.]